MYQQLVAMKLISIGQSQPDEIDRVSYRTMNGELNLAKKKVWMVLSY